MLPPELLTEIIIQADYDTTIKLLTIFPKLDKEEFWQQKCLILYPNKTYLSAFSGKENYLIKERTFVITCDYENNMMISNILIKYDPLLEEYIKIVEHASIRSMTMIKIDIVKRFVIIKYCGGDGDEKFSILFQSDKKEECIENIKEDAIKAKYDHDYYIIDINDFILWYNIKGYTKQVKYQYEYAGKYGYGF